jgi:hypothetical protein
MVGSGIDRVEPRSTCRAARGRAAPGADRRPRLLRRGSRGPDAEVPSQPLGTRGRADHALALAPRRPSRAEVPRNRGSADPPPLSHCADPPPDALAVLVPTAPPSLRDEGRPPSPTPRAIKASRRAPFASSPAPPPAIAVTTLSSHLRSRPLSSSATRSSPRTHSTSPARLFPGRVVLSLDVQLQRPPPSISTGRARCRPSRPSTSAQIDP